MTATKRRTRTHTKWDVPVTCVEVARAMYRAGQPRHEVRWRLERMRRWACSTIYNEMWQVECELDLNFSHGNCATVRAWREAAE